MRFFHGGMDRKFNGQHCVSKTLVFATSRVRRRTRHLLKQSKTCIKPNSAVAQRRIRKLRNHVVSANLLGDPQGRFPHIPGSYVRDALKNGVAMQDARGFNPYKTGFVGGSDSHNTGVPYRQDNYFGGHAFEDGGLKERMSCHLFAGADIRMMNPAGFEWDLGGGKYPRLAFRSHAAQGDVCHQRSAHQAAFLRRLGIWS